jgi:hypothetical protein
MLKGLSMWVCPECKNQNPTLSDLCSVCGTSPDGSKKAAKTQFPKDVGVTRRFSVGTFMIMTAFFGVLFAVLKILDTNPILFCCVAVFFAGIGVAQMALFGGNEPRKASLVAGFPLGYICGLGGTIVYRWLDQSPLPFGIQPNNIFVTAILYAVIGGPCGYLAGCLIAGIFLVRERESDEETDAQGTFEDDEEDDSEKSTDEN